MDRQRQRDERETDMETGRERRDIAKTKAEAETSQTSGRRLVWARASQSLLFSLWPRVL